LLDHEFHPQENAPRTHHQIRDQIFERHWWKSFFQDGAEAVVPDVILGKVLDAKSGALAEMLIEYGPRATGKADLDAFGRSQRNLGDILEKLGNELQSPIILI
jgi:hypothetical protein